MKKIAIQTNYHTQWGQTINIIGSIPELGNWDKQQARQLSCITDSIWQVDLEIPDNITTLEFSFLVMENGAIIRQEDGDVHQVSIGNADTYIECIWQEKPQQSYFLTSIFSNSIFKHNCVQPPKLSKNQVQLIVTCLHVEQGQEVVISGNSTELGEWDENKAISLLPTSYGKWHIILKQDSIAANTAFKLAVRDTNSKKIMEWEDSENRYLSCQTEGYTAIQELRYKKNWINWRASGVAIPIFSLRSQNSFGIGEFSDLNLLVDWAANAKLRVVQVLPINDTTATYSWIDSYPYNAISIYALHPIYLGLHQYPLKDKVKNEEYTAQASKLNKLDVIDYTEVINLKNQYIKDLYTEIGASILATKAYKQFYQLNKTWLFPYACFCHLRDKYKTVAISKWNEFAIYNKENLEEYTENSKDAENNINRVYFTQYLLHKQLTEAKEYAYTKGVVLKGDIPIGISPNSVDAWTEPHLFNLDTQTGAPPDDFSVNGQNWGFPTYNWREMQKDNFQWWTKRFVKMADYFDAYRIDHILGFFRIWEIPDSSVQGLLGHFSPALPMSSHEINSWGITFEEQMTVATIHRYDMDKLFQEYSEEVENNYLIAIDEFWYVLKEEYNTQKKIEKAFSGKDSKKDLTIRDGLFTACNEVLFIRDKYDSDKFHPRISLQHTLRYNYLNASDKNSLNRLYEDYFYHRHSQYWKEEAMSKLPTLAAATNMLVCGEDLGMVPESVPSVMNDLQILSLEIQRMPKQLGMQFSDLSQLPYLSVATTSTHDMSPIRLWWKENTDNTQNYYQHTLHLQGKAPCECNTAISLLIIKQHLESPAMLTILPLQDWLALSDKLKREKVEQEKINEPSNPHHNWNYRMHLTLEELIENKDFSDLIRFLNEESGR